MTAAGDSDRGHWVTGHDFTGLLYNAVEAHALLGASSIPRIRQQSVTLEVHLTMSTLYRILTVLTILTATACVQAQAPTDLGDPVSPSSSSTPGANAGPTTPTISTTGPFLYNQDIKAILDADCLSCHGPRRADGGYSVATYTQTMRAVRAGNANSALISQTRSGGGMYRYWSGATATRQAKADMIRVWIVNNTAQENR